MKLYSFSPRCMAFSLKKLIFGKNKRAPHVLIIEDDALLARVLSEALAKENIEAVVVNNGLKAMEVAQNMHPRVILLDLVLPGIDGFEILKQLKSDKTMKKVPVAIISNLSDAPDVKSVKVLGAEEYFIKANTRLEKIVDYVKSKL